MDQDITKRVGVKFVNSNRGTEVHFLTPGTTTRDLLIRLGLDPTGFKVLDGRNTRDFQLDEILFAQVIDGDLLHVSARIDVGSFYL
jgi:hypothetical protein